MSKTIHTCLRCAVPVEEEKLADSSCLDPNCPLNDDRKRAEQDRDRKRAEQAVRPAPSKLPTILNAG